jgi:uncharacterized membrane protein
MQHATRGVTINKPKDDVYEFWHDFENLGRFMQHLELVEDLGSGRSHWVARAPAGMTVEWDAKITEDLPGERIAWQSLPGSEVYNSGSVQFRDAPGDRGTEITVRIEYEIPGGAAAAKLAKLFREEPHNQLRDDLRRFKQVMETGEVVRSDGSLGGAGQGALKQRPAQSADNVTIADQLGGTA